MGKLHVCYLAVLYFRERLLHYGTAYYMTWCDLYFCRLRTEITAEHMERRIFTGCKLWLMFSVWSISASVQGLLLNRVVQMWPHCRALSCVGVVVDGSKFIMSQLQEIYKVILMQPINFLTSCTSAWKSISWYSLNHNRSLEKCSFTRQLTALQIGVEAVQALFVLRLDIIIFVAYLFVFYITWRFFLLFHYKGSFLGYQR